MSDFINKNFILKDGIFDFNLKDTVTLKVGKFYEEDPFPNYKINYNKNYKFILNFILILIYC